MSDFPEHPKLAVVIPCYRVQDTIRDVVAGLPDWIAHIVTVNDASPDRTGEILEEMASDNDKLTVLHHAANQGVGGAMGTGYRAALEMDVDIVVKVDGDGQMDPKFLPELIQPLLDGRADYAKGNRFRFLKDLRKMPRSRLIGNVGLTFLTKVASGCWHVVDVQNGYLAITKYALEALPLDRVEKSYAFENWMLTQVSINNFRVIDVPMPAIYGDEISSLSIGKSLWSFPPKLVKLFLERFFLRYVIYDLSPIAIYFFAGCALLLFGGLFGGYHWWQAQVTGVPTLTGRIALALLPVLLGVNFLLNAIDLDIRNTPKPRDIAPDRPSRREPPS